MGGFRIRCTLDEQVYRILEIPEDITLKDLGECLEIVFGWESSGHGFLVSEGRIPVTLSEDAVLQEIEESDICPVRLLEEDAVLLYRCAASYQNYEVVIKKEKKLPSYKNVLVRVKEAQGVISKKSIFGEGDDPEETQELPSVRNLNRLLSECPPERMGSCAPTLDELADSHLRVLEEKEKELGLDLGTVFERMDQKTKTKDIPRRPEIKCDAGVLYQNMQEAEKFFQSHKETEISVTTGEKTVLDMLRGLNTVETYDYCKYLQLFEVMHETDAKKQEALCQVYLQEPQVLLYPLTEKEAAALLKFPELAREGEVWRTDSVSPYIMMGLALFHPENRVLELAEDLPEILAGITEKEFKKTRKLLSEFDEGFPILVKHYGILELDEVQKMMARYFQMHIAQKKCSRMIYWKYSLMGDFTTLTFEDRFYVMEKGLNPRKILEGMMYSEFMFPYAEMEQWEIEAWKRKNDYMAVFSGWTYLYGLLVFQTKMEKEKAREFCDALYSDVRNGADLGYCMQALGVDQGTNKLEGIRMLLWEVSLHFLLGTAMPGLKGARKVIVPRNPAYSFSPAAYFVENPVAEDQIRTGTHIEDMPEKLQIELASRMFTLEESDLEQMKWVLSRYPDNIDLNFLYGEACQRLHHMDDAIRFFKRADRLSGGKDESIKLSIQECEKGLVRKPISFGDDGIVYM